MKPFSIVIPARTGSTRVASKNVRSFAGYKGGLLELKLAQLKLASNSNLVEIIVSTNDPIAIEIADQAKRADGRVKIDRRPDYLCKDNTQPGDLITYFAGLIRTPVLMQALCTSPFVTGADYLDIAIAYFDNHCDDLEGYDSLATVKEIRNFVMDSEGDIVNRIGGSERWPRTQDLPPLYELNHAVYMHTRKEVIRTHDRIGDKPLLYKMNFLKSMDIDWPLDFDVAEALVSLKNKM